MKEIDLRQGDKEFRVPTRVVRDGVAYMGPDVLVTARDHEHAKAVAKHHGHDVNNNFAVTRVMRTGEGNP